MTEMEEKIFDEKTERYFQGQRELPNGRDYRWNTFRFDDKKTKELFRTNYDKVFPNAPGAGI